MTGFGDYDAGADAYDPTTPPDPEQVARKLAALEGFDYDGDLDDAGRLRRLSVVVALLAWLTRSGHLRP